MWVGGVWVGEAGMCGKGAEGGEGEGGGEGGERRMQETRGHHGAP